ncbi:MAG: hypothetical protein UT34_C0001G0117 [candidate division WS6 bacterium GW2011_GWF2_39_15]|uniref:Mannosyl-glycoprotein endo-beta-N-acetylglucosamidase-like domain-containing protein n=1 Tax=candidate division WS6 bacterium GW2011_GWF2_39_15 TaxID=1619100 RepID=A0A0G0QWQ5_9BACT|nr:MAG: hypothetical protein UT34_C0001G0117 [candidate division WS6 bacterium GW2011_GWF2_39_15]
MSNVRSLISKSMSLLGFIILFSLFHLVAGGKFAQTIGEMVGFNRKLVEVNRLSALETRSIYLTSSDPSFLLSGDISQVSGQTTVTTSDPRVLAMRQFLIDHYSPLYTYADIFVSEADKVGLDWRLVASISGVESAFGNLIPYRSNNGWGWRGGPGGAYSIFSSWKEGISTVTGRLAAGYGTDLTPFQIEPTYCPPCGQNPSHAWANGVTQFMSDLNYYVRNLESVY